MKVLVTGPGGFLGSHLCKKLVDEGHEVIGISRSHYQNIEDLGVKLYKGDLASDKNKNLKKSLEGVEAIFHTASKVAMWGDYDDFVKTNYEGTKNLITLAKEAGVKYFVYTSTPSVVFQETSLEGVDESVPYAEYSYSMYAKSKILAEKFVLESESENFHVLALRPHLIYGPGDKNIIPRLIARAKKGRLKIVGDGKNKVDVLHVTNAVHAHILGLDALINKPESRGQAYFIGNEEPVVLWDFIGKILTTLGIPAPKSRIPFLLAFTIGSFFESLFGMLRLAGMTSEPPMTRFVALQLAYSHYFSHDKAHRLLGYSPIISTEDSIKTLEGHFTR